MVAHSSNLTKLCTEMKSRALRTIDDALDSRTKFSALDNDLKLIKSATRSSVDSDSKLDETLDFFVFSHKSGSEYEGTIVFEFTSDGSTCSQSDRIIKKSVRVSRDRAHIVDGEPDDGLITCRVTLGRDIFLGVYSGAVSPRSAIVNGDVKVHNWAFGELRRFGNSFDFRTEKWNEFYAVRSQRVHLQRHEFCGDQPSALGAIAADMSSPWIGDSEYEAVLPFSASTWAFSSTWWSWVSSLGASDSVVAECAPSRPALQLGRSMLTQSHIARSSALREPVASAGWSSAPCQNKSSSVSIMRRHFESAARSNVIISEQRPQSVIAKLQARTDQFIPSGITLERVLAANPF